MLRYEIINRLLETIDGTHYLEIGIDKGECFEKIRCANKTGIDPVLSRYPHDPTRPGERLLQMTSDKFFELDTGDKYDLIFIDGLHDFEQVIRDIRNGRDKLKENGLIVLHDTQPPDERYITTVPTLKSKAGNWLWCGSVWKIFSWLWYENFRFRTVATDYGVTVLWPGRNDFTGELSPEYDWDLDCIKITKEFADWKIFDKHRNRIARVAELEDIIKEINAR